MVGWCHGRAHVWRVGVAGLALHGEVFAGWVGVVVGLHAVAGLMCGGTCVALIHLLSPWLMKR